MRIAIRRIGPVLAALVLITLLPGDAYGWGPGTHVYLGSELLRHLDVLGPAAAALLSSRPRAFLYGMLAPDLLVAKDRAPAGTHSHGWERVDELLRAAGTDDARIAAVLGYRTHLAADTVAHSFFLPRRLLLTASTRAIGHSYWEHRIEARLPDRFADRAEELVLAHADGPVEALFRDVLTPTVFDFETNRRIYGEMVRWSSHGSWQLLFGHLVDQSRWRLEAEERQRALELSVVLSLESVRTHGAASRRGNASREARLRILDPTGRDAMERAKEMRRSVLRSGRWDGRWEPSDRLRHLADRCFPLPAVEEGGDGGGALDRMVEAVGDGDRGSRTAA